VTPQSRHKRWRNTTITTAVAVGLVVGSAASASASGPSGAAASTVPVSTASSADKLGAHDRALLTSYQAMLRARRAPVNPDAPVPDYATLMLAVDPAQTEAAVAAITAAGGTVNSVNADVGYVKVNVPFDKVDAVVGVPAVQRADVDELVELEDTSIDSVAESRSHSGELRAPNARTPEANDYLPTEDLGSVTFKRQNKKFDGRGVTIGIMDTGIDPTHPALQKTTTGEKKLVASSVATDPTSFIDIFLIENTWSYVTPSDKVTTPTTERSGITWTMPGGGGDDLYLRTRLYSSFHPADTTLTGYQGFVWRPSDNAVWLDSNNDHVFTDDELVRPYNETGDIGYFGTDDPATAINERQPFTTDFRAISESISAVDINTLDEAHGTHVAGIAAGNRILGGRMMGQAPGAKLVSMRACTSRGCSSAALTDGMVSLAEDYGVDVINMSIGGIPALNDGQSAMSLLYDRLIEDTGVQIIVSAGNSGTGTNTVADPSVASDVISVGASVTRETWKVDYGSQTRARLSVFPFSSRGPSEDGTLKPDITAPGAAISSVPSWLDEAPAVPETGYTLPTGYGMMQGTSMAAPEATGAAALLLSAAKQSHVSATPAELRDALYTTANSIPSEQASAQGRGQIDVPAAWRMLRHRSSGADDITVSAPVCTALSDQLVTPNSGTGLVNRCAANAGGQKAGESRSYTVTLTRTSGSDRTENFLLKLRGDDGTFRVQPVVKLAKNTPTTVTVTARPRTDGLHDAVLTIDNPRTQATDAWAMLTVEAAATLSARPWTVTSRVDRNDTVVYAVAVPEGTASLSVDLSGIAEGSQTRWWAFTPDGLSGEKKAQATSYCYANYADGNGCDPLSRTYANPDAGVWEFVVEARRTSPQLSNPFTLTASVTPAE